MANTFEKDWSFWPRRITQASEKLWGACAEIIKAVAAKRGVELGTHRSFGDFVVKLYKEHPEWGLMNTFREVNALHTDFYEDWLPAEVVEDAAETVKAFIARLKGVL